jgi:hypothetical protein
MTEMIEPMPGAIDQGHLARDLVVRAQDEGVELVGPRGLLSGLSNTVLDSAKEAQMSEHVGHDKHDPAGRDSGNSRHGTRAKTVLTETSTLQIEVPRDRDSSFGLQVCVSGGWTGSSRSWEVAAHFDKVYGAKVSRGTISQDHREGGGGDDRATQRAAGSSSRRCSSTPCDSHRCGIVKHQISLACWARLLRACVRHAPRRNWRALVTAASLRRIPSARCAHSCHTSSVTPLAAALMTATLARMAAGDIAAIAVANSSATL